MPLLMPLTTRIFYPPSWNICPLLGDLGFKSRGTQNITWTNKFPTWSLKGRPYIVHMAGPLEGSLRRDIASSSTHGKISHHQIWHVPVSYKQETFVPFSSKAIRRLLITVIEMEQKETLQYRNAQSPLTKSDVGSCGCTLPTFYSTSSLHNKFDFWCGTIEQSLNLDPRTTSVW